ncbi:MAG: hypothetical protein MUC60_05580 [Oscillatoria sp. Prado101]|nr:hypothetical protein [Oscillatoria sp. Prado101]
MTRYIKIPEKSPKVEKPAFVEKTGFYRFAFWVPVQHRQDFSGGEFPPAPIGLVVLQPAHASDSGDTQRSNSPVRRCGNF